MARRRSAARIGILCLHSSPIATLGRTDAGGMNLYVQRLADGLGDAGFDVDVYTRRTDRATPHIVPLNGSARLIHLSAGPVRRLPRSVLPLHLPAMVAAMCAFVAEQGIEYDLLHSHYWLSGLAGMRFRARSGQDVPLIHMFHTLARVKEHYLGRPDPGDSALRADGERCVISRADVIVGATESERDEMTRLYGRQPAGFEVIPPGVDLDRFRPIDRRLSRQTLGLDGRRIVLFVGREDAMKGLDTLLTSVAQLPATTRHGLKVLLVGGHEGRHSDDTARRRRAVARLGLQDSVEVRGNVSQADLPLYYSAADVCAVPSVYESFGMVALEAMACQTPVVSFAVGGLAVTVKPGQTGFLARPGDGGDFRRHLQLALESSQLDAMGRQARMSAQRFSWNNTVRRTVELYESQLRGHAATTVPAAAGN